MKDKEVFLINTSPLVNQKAIINDFSIRIATPNGSGSQTANWLIMRALFKMGIPVSGKNIFPSNIQGQPTWYTIRCNPKGYTARCPQSEILVAMNPRTVLEDIAQVKAGGVVFYPDHLEIPTHRDDVTFYSMPVKSIVNSLKVDPKHRDYVANMVYVGVLAESIGIELTEIETALNRHFQGKREVIEINFNAIKKAADWARTNLTKTDPYRVERMNATTDLILIDGNTAAALGAIYGGVSFVAWYPITPATGLADALTTYLGRLRRDPQSGEKTYIILQLEDEIATIGCVIGAGWAGARAMTCTSGPGISLMTEFIGYGYFAEIPAVIWDIQRMGPATGLPTRVSQGDLLSTHFLGHGDTKHVCLLPGNVVECFEFGWRAFDLAECLQTPVFVLSDLDLGMNQWPSPRFEYPSETLDRGKVLTAKDLEKVGHYARYEDRDGDGIAYRTLPGTEHPLASHFTRGSGHTPQATLSERPEDWENNTARLKRKWKTAHQYVPEPVVTYHNAARLGIIAFGSTDPAVVEAADYLAKSSIRVSYLRLRALPFSKGVRAFLEAHKRIYVVELNSDGQLCQLLRMAYPELADRLVSLCHNNGLPLSAAWVVEQIIAHGEV